jgi:CheY-like chemotaxis protein
VPTQKICDRTTGFLPAPAALDLIDADSSSRTLRQLNNLRRLSIKWEAPMLSFVSGSSRGRMIQQRERRPVPAHVVVVHDDQEFLADVVAALKLENHSVAAFVDPMAALDALDAALSVEVLITRVQFSTGKPNGLALARMARARRPRIRILFTALPEFAEHAEGLGTFMALPVKVSDMVDAVERMLKSDAQDLN